MTQSSAVPQIALMVVLIELRVKVPVTAALFKILLLNPLLIIPKSAVGLL